MTQHRNRPTRPTRRSSSPLAGADTYKQLLDLIAAKDIDALIDAAFRAVRATVVCDFASAFYRSTGNGLLRERDSRGRDYGPAFMRRYMELTPALPIALANRGIKSLATRTALALPETALRKTPFYLEVMQAQGWRHAVALCFWGDPGADAPVFVTSVYRSEGQRDFSARDVRRLEDLHPFLDCAVNRVYEMETARTIHHGTVMAVQGSKRGVALLDGSLRVIQANPAAHELSAMWEDDDSAELSPPGVSRKREMPSSLLMICRQLHHEWKSLLGVNPEAIGMSRQRRLTHPHVLGLVATITLVCPSSSGLAAPNFVLEFDRLSQGAAPDVSHRSLSVLQSMTVAERAVAIVLADGLSNQEIADRLGKTVHAVKFLLHRIYQKTSLRNRAALVAAVLASLG